MASNEVILTSRSILPLYKRLDIGFYEDPDTKCIEDFECKYGLNTLSIIDLLSQYH